MTHTSNREINNAMKDRPLHLIEVSDDGSREDSPPSSGAQTPAACRPLLRHAQAMHTWPNLRLSDATHLNNLREQNMLEAAMNSPSRSLSYDALSHLKQVQDELEDVAFTPKPTRHGPSAESPLRSRRPPALRRVSHEVREREQSLQREVEALRDQLREQEDKKRAESMLVGFVFNRILEQQRTRMAVQQQLLNKLGALDLKGTGLPETFSRRKDN
ncbi:hypothetical protein DOTSEDRAFT_72968 [Dothistroma septosporum NZE10]|uniref:Uncharacterized protein n=1 Tax=Dothistroma septosporum (strain NZE10 / CBS 128990) TaxID=675120 RepID=N1PIT7_DOTSN|nr:hypothetical protein DOTSEDRAFT_72968 [Dothistroma septosporum NZE10]